MMKLTKRELKKVEKVIEKYNYWVAHNMITDEWEEEDYENAMGYEDINGNIIVIERDEEGNIIYAWD